ncbi:MoxR family ATPase [Chitinophagales bacterium]|nr:MoxR family ATPase [Chitinophagales bacterium]
MTEENNDLPLDDSSRDHSLNQPDLTTSAQQDVVSSATNEVAFENRLDLSELSQKMEAAKREVHKIIKGQEEMVHLLLIALLNEGHVLLEGVPGVAKTLAAKLTARTVATDFSRIQFTPDLMPSDVLGTSVYNFKTSEFEFKKGPIFSNFILIDEINRAPAKTQAALFEVMEEQQVTIDGKQYKMTAPFFVIATQNPIEQEGTYRLPEAQLDRFLFKVEVDYPSIEDEVSLLEDFHVGGNRHKSDVVKAVITPEMLVRFKELIRLIKVDPSLIRYITQVVAATRNNKNIYLGASPRASLSILKAAKAEAALQGRDFVTPDDIKMIAIPVLRHRLILSPELEMEGVKIDKVIDSLLKRVEVPR